jgi:hypothetical protein
VAELVQTVFRGIDAEMIKKAVVISCFVSYLLVGGCISFKIAPRPEPEQLVETLVLCKRVLPDGELLAPADVTTDFVLENSDVHCFVEIKNVGQIMTLKWKWYAPDETLFKETVDVLVNENEAYLEAVTAYDKLDILQEEGFKGLWVVVILINGELAGRRTFNVR